MKPITRDVCYIILTLLAIVMSAMIIVSASQEEIAWCVFFSSMEVNTLVIAVIMSIQERREQECRNTK